MEMEMEIGRDNKINILGINLSNLYTLGCSWIKIVLLEVYMIVQEEVDQRISKINVHSCHRFHREVENWLQVHQNKNKTTRK